MHVKNKAWSRKVYLAYLEATTWTILKDRKCRVADAKVEVLVAEVIPKRVFYLAVLKVVYGLSEKQRFASSYLSAEKERALQEVLYSTSVKLNMNATFIS